MSPLRSVARLLTLLAVSAVLSGCLSTVRGPAFPPPIRLGSPQNFTLYASDPPTSALVARCVVRRVDASVVGIRGDTLLLTGVRVLEQAPGSQACVSTDSLRLLMASDTLVKAEKLALQGERSILLIFALLPLFLAGALLILLFAGGGYPT